MKLVSVLILIILISGCINQESKETIYVQEVIDGDTFILSNGDHIRLIGANTPEKGEYYYDEATEVVKDLILNREVILKSDINSKDKYRRYLKYVYVDDIFVNQYIVENGYARSYIIEPNVMHADKFRDAEDIARDKRIGIWA